MGEPKPVFRHSVAKAEMGECYCPKCAPQMHAPPVQAMAPEAPTENSEAATGSEAAKSASPTPQGPHWPIAVGGDALPRTKEAIREKALALREQLRTEESQWLKAYGDLHEAATRSRAADQALAFTRQHLKELTAEYFRVRCDAAELPRPWIERPRWEALVEAQRAANALVGRMAVAGPDWSDSVRVERDDLVAALARLDKVSHG